MCTLYLWVIDRFEHLNDEVLFHSAIEASYATNFQRSFGSVFNLQ